MACFGSPKFDKKEPFHILSADSRFPDVAVGKQLPSGNHFLAVFPVPEQQAALDEWIKKERKRKRKRKQVRGGGSSELMDEMARKRMALKNNMAQQAKNDESAENSIQSCLRGFWKRLF